MRYLKTNVRHNGTDFAKGDECPKDLEQEFILQGLLEPEVKKAEPKPAAQAANKPAEPKPAANGK